MDKCTIRRAILETIADACPAPCNAERIAQGVLLKAGAKMAREEILRECRELEARGYLANLKNNLDPVFNGISGTARDQLDMAARLDPAIWGDSAL